MNEASTTLLCLLLPEAILDYFDLTNASKDAVGVNIYLEEKNIAAAGYQDQALESKGFFPEVRIQDFPIVVRKSRYVLSDNQPENHL